MNGFNLIVLNFISGILPMPAAADGLMGWASDVLETGCLQTPPVATEEQKVLIDQSGLSDSAVSSLYGAPIKIGYQVDKKGRVLSFYAAILGRGDGWGQGIRYVCSQSELDRLVEQMKARAAARASALSLESNLRSGGK